MVQYWLDLFTPETWEEARTINFGTTGFREARWSLVQKIQPGDLMVCYITKISRFSGILKVISKPYKNPVKAKTIWKHDTFPCLMEVEPVITMDSVNSIPTSEVISKLTIASKWAGIVRGSPNRIPLEDGEIISKLLETSLKQSRIYPLDKKSRHYVRTSTISIPKNLLYGEPINFRGLRHAPINEQGVVFMFALVAKDLGFVVEGIGTAFPDCEAMRKIEHLNRWQKVRIEFENHSSDFRKHGHDLNGCDMIVCWEHDWKECPLEVIELSSKIKKLSN